MNRSSVVHSGVYSGKVRHRRFGGVDHSFTMGLDLTYLDVDEIDEAFKGRWFWSARRPAPMRFCRSDYFGTAETPLGESVCDAVEQSLGFRPDGAVRVLTGLRCFGYAFNPVSFYYCFDSREKLVAVLSQITNTPWGERHHYVHAADDRGRVIARFAKEFHVSPFQPMEHDYIWRFTTPASRLLVHMENHTPSGKAFDVTLVMTKKPWSTANLLRSWLRHPCMSLSVIATIYWHAFRLWLRRAPFYKHPRHRAQA